MNVPFLLFILVFSLFPSQAAADSLACENGIVSNGDLIADLLVKCGEPEWKESHEEDIVESVERDVKRKTLITVERWTYNFGPDRFMRIVTVRNGVIAAIDTGGYGTAKDRVPPGPGCGDRIISIGDTKADIIVRCGEPFTRSSREERIREKIDGSRYRTVTVTIDEWTYDFGPRRFMRVITFRNGLVTDIRTAGYGAP